MVKKLVKMIKKLVKGLAKFKLESLVTSATRTRHIACSILIVQYRSFSKNRVKGAFFFFWLSQKNGIPSKKFWKTSKKSKLSEKFGQIIRTPPQWLSLRDVPPQSEETHRSKCAHDYPLHCNCIDPLHTTPLSFDHDR